MYGGSTTDNTEAILGVAGVDGLLVGGASPMFTPLLKLLKAHGTKQLKKKA